MQSPNSRKRGIPSAFRSACCRKDTNRPANRPSIYRLLRKALAKRHLAGVAGQCLRRRHSESSRNGTICGHVLDTSHARRRPELPSISTGIGRLHGRLAARLFLPIVATRFGLARESPAFVTTRPSEIAPAQGAASFRRPSIIMCEHAEGRGKSSRPRKGLAF